MIYTNNRIKFENWYKYYMYITENKAPKESNIHIL